MDVLDGGVDATLGKNGFGQEFLHLPVVDYGQKEMAWYDPHLLGVPRLAPGQREELIDQVLYDGCDVDGRGRAYPIRVVPLLQVAMNTTDRERQSSFRRF